MSQVTGGVVLGRALKSMGVDTVLYLPGGPCTGLLSELFRLGVRTIETRHEQAAAMMAHAYSRVTGKVGVCITSSAYGTSNTVTGVGVALDDCAPLLAIGGSAAIGERGMGAFEEMDQVQVMRPVTKAAWQVQNVENIPRFVDNAFRVTTGGKPGPVYLDMPADILYGEVSEDHVKLPTLPNRERPTGEEKSIEKALSILQQAERPIVIAGSGAVWSEAGPELREFVEATGIPFFTTPLGRGLIPEDHPLFFGGSRSFAWKNADAALVVGTRANWIVSFLSPPRFSAELKVIMVNIDPEEIGHNKPVDVGIIGDAKAVLRQFVEHSHGKSVGKATSLNSWIEKLKEVDAKRQEEILPQMNSDEKPIHPLRLCKEIKEFLNRDAILTVDGNETLNFARQTIPSYYPAHRLNPGVGGCIGVAVPFGIGAKIAKPEKQVLVLSGDLSFGFNGMEMDVAIRNKINVVVVVVNNSPSEMKESPKATNPDYLPSQDLPQISPPLGLIHYDKVVEALGGWGEHVEEPQQIRPALERAFASGKPALINVVVDRVRANTARFAWWHMNL